MSRAKTVRKIAVIGAGYVGLVTAACLAKLGHRVTCVEADRDKAAAVRKNQLPIWRMFDGALVGRTKG